MLDPRAGDVRDWTKAIDRVRIGDPGVAGPGSMVDEVLDAFRGVVPTFDRFFRPTLLGLGDHLRVIRVPYDKNASTAHGREDESESRQVRALTYPVSRPVHCLLESESWTRLYALILRVHGILLSVHRPHLRPGKVLRESGRGG